VGGRQLSTRGKEGIVMNRPGRILMVENEERWRKLVGDTLRSGGFHVDTASTLVEAEAALRSLNRTNVHVRAGDGYAGWPEEAPFDRVIVTAAPEEIPRPLIDQLATGGLLVAPVGTQSAPQWMTIVEKTRNGVVERRTIPVQFVPFTRGPAR